MDPLRAALGLSHLSLAKAPSATCLARLSQAFALGKMYVVPDTQVYLGYSDVSMIVWWEENDDHILW